MMNSDHIGRGELNSHHRMVALSGAEEWLVIPPTGRESLLVELHGGHPGVSRMKSPAHGLVWWPNLDVEIEKMVGQCSSCQQYQPSPPAAPVQPWSWPANLW